MNNSVRPMIAISSCLLGRAVRYDGATKLEPELCSALKQYFELLEVCPEVEIGLSVPRPPVQLTGDSLQPRMTGRDDASIDITERMRAYCRNKPNQLGLICGYVFKSRSPSCGLHDVPLFDQGKMMQSNYRGLFAQAITSKWPDLPVADEIELQNKHQITQFVAKVLNFQNVHFK